MDLTALSDFNLVATHGGFGRASRASGRSKATLSRRVMELEESLGVRLLERSSTALKLTDEGHALYARTEGLMKDLSEIGETIGGLDRPHGRLRINAPVLFAHVALGRIAAGFIARFPEVKLEITADDRPVDLIDDGFDLVIRVNPRFDETLVGRCFVRDELMMVAAPHLEPPSPDALVPAVTLLAAPDDAIWAITTATGIHHYHPSPVLRLSSILMIHDAVRAGAGTALLPRWMVADDLASGRLVSWGASDRKIELWVLHTSRRLASRKVTEFVTFLCDAFPQSHL